MDNTLGNRLEKIKKNERLSMEEYADLMGVTKTSYYNWKNGENHPNSDVLVRILEKYPKYSADWLLLGIGNMYREKTLQEVNEAPEGYGLDYLTKRVNELAKEVEELRLEVKKKNEVIFSQGKLLSSKTYGLSPQKRRKKVKQ